MMRPAPDPAIRRNTQTRFGEVSDGMGSLRPHKAVAPRAFPFRAWVAAIFLLIPVFAGTSSRALAEGPGKPFDLWSNFDAQSLTLTMHWTAGPGPAPVDYLVEYRLDPAGPWFPGFGDVDVAAASFTSQIPQGLYEPLELDARVIALGDGGLQSEPSEPLHITVPATPWPPSERFVVASSAGTLLADHDTLVAKGLDTFPDGLVSVVPTDTPGVYDFYANQGDGSDGMGGSLGTGYGRTRGTLADPFAVVMDTRGPIVNPIVPVDYMGGGAVWRDPATGALVMLYHREIYTRMDGVPTGAFWSSIGAAVSTDGGATFVDAGEVLTPDIELLSPNRGPSGNGPGDFSTFVRDGWLYAYYNDNLEDGSMVLAVARTSVAELSAAVAGGPAPVFWKYHDGAFSEPGIGGTPSNLTPGHAPFNPSVAYSSSHDELVMVATIYTSQTGSMLAVLTSKDGVHWSEPEALYPALASFRIYNTLLGDSVSPEGNRVITGSTLKVLAVNFNSSSDFWSAHEVRLIEITDTRSACPSDIDGDGEVTSADVALILLDFGACVCPTDLDGDGEVGSGDVAICLLDFGACP